MGRKSEVAFYESKHGYFTTIKGVRYRLHSCWEDDAPDGPHYVAALVAFRKIIEDTSAAAPKDGTVRAHWLRWEQHLARSPKNGLETIRSLLRPFVARLGHVEATYLEPQRIVEFIDSRAAWGASTRFLVWQRLKTMFLWNRTYAGSKADPFHGTRTPAAYEDRARGEQFALPEELVRLVIDQADGRLREILGALAATGARPGELINAERANLRFGERMIVHRGDEQRLYVHKTARRKKKGDNTRRIMLDASTLDVAARNASAGRWLFPAPKGGRWLHGPFHCAIDDLRSRPVVNECLIRYGLEPRHIIPYAFRHTWITRAIQRGISIKKVADLTGTSVVMIERHYSHATADVAGLYEDYRRCMGE